jgi:hypothetical protein
MSNYETLLVRTAHAVMTVTLSNPPINLETDAIMADLDRPVTRLEGRGERRYFTPSRSTSNISVAPGGMSPPAPRAP